MYSKVIEVLIGIMAILVPGMGWAQSPLEGDIVILGDSNIWLAGDSCNKHQGWVSWMNEALGPRSCRSYARSGASWSNTAETKTNPDENTAILGNDNVIYNQVIRLIVDHALGKQATPDVILVDAGGNDAWFAEKRPQEFTMTVDEVFAESDSALLSRHPSQVLSLAGAVRQNALMLSRAFPDARIVFISSTPMTKVEPELLCHVSDIIEQTGERMGIPTLRLDLECPISRDEELKAHVNTYDGVHTNEAGAERVGTYVAKQLRLMIQ